MRCLLDVAETELMAVRLLEEAEQILGEPSRTQGPVLGNQLRPRGGGIDVPKDRGRRRLATQEHHVVDALPRTEASDFVADMKA